MEKSLSVVIPCYCSPPGFEIYVEAVAAELSAITSSFEIICIDDASPDEGQTWIRLQALAERNEYVACHQLINNVGQQLAVIAGFQVSSGEFIVTLDDDGQHDPRYISDMLALARQHDLVIAKLVNRKAGFFRKLASTLVRVLARSNFDIPDDFSFSSFRVINGQKARQIISFRTLTPVVGFELLSVCASPINYKTDHIARLSGKSTYSLVKLLQFFHQLAYTYTNFYPRISFWFSVAFGTASVVASLFLLISLLLGYDYKSGYLTNVMLICGSFTINFIILSVLLSVVKNIQSTSDGRPRYEFSNGIF